MSKTNYLSGMLVGNQELERAMADILANDARQTPIVAEDVFISQIIPILQRPWVESNITKYRRYVPEPTMGLRVAGVRNGETIVLFTVPPMHAPVDTTSASINGITVNHLIEHASILRHRGTNEPVEQYINEYLHQISQQVPVEQKLLVPLGAILGLYGKTLLDDLGHPLYTLDGVANPQTGVVASSQEESTFVSSGYLDED